MVSDDEDGCEETEYYPHTHEFPNKTLICVGQTNAYEILHPIEVRKFPSSASWG